MRLSLECLDNQRLGKQRVEAYQIWRVITGLSQSKAWRRTPAAHMWRGYADALGVYININCQIWGRRKSKSGNYFSNGLMNEHIRRFNFGKNAEGRVVFELEEEEHEEEKVAEAPDAKVEEEEEEDAVMSDPEAAAEKSDNDKGEGMTIESTTTVATKITLPAAASDVAQRPSLSAAAVGPSGASAASAQQQQRSGQYVDGIRIPWWLHLPQVHDSDAAILYRKDPKHYKQFKSHAKKYDEYVWPRDIDPYHPEQQIELDALNTILAAEEKEKQKQLEKKKKAKEEAVAKRAAARQSKGGSKKASKARAKAGGASASSAEAQKQEQTAAAAADAMEVEQATTATAAETVSPPRRGRSRAIPAPPAKASGEELTELTNTLSTKDVGARQQRTTAGKTRAAKRGRTQSSTVNDADSSPTATKENDAAGSRKRRRVQQDASEEKAPAKRALRL